MLLLFTGCIVDLEFGDLYDERNVYLGWYEVEEYSEASSTTFLYDITITKSRYDDNVVWIDNFYDANIRVFAEVNGYSLYIPAQRVDYFEIEGRGTMYGGDELSITYTVRENVIGPDYVDFLSSVAWKY
jgi:hypothetical protein